jgi:hypothetical protein
LFSFEAVSILEPELFNISIAKLLSLSNLLLTDA